MSVPYNHSQVPRPLPVLRPGRRLTWLRACLIGLDCNGNDTNGVFYGRYRPGSTPLALYRLDYPDGTWQAFRGPGRRIDLLAKLGRLYPKATIEFGEPIMPQFGVAIDHAHERPISCPPETIADRAAAIARGEERPSMSRGQRWKALRDAKHPKAPEAREYSRKLQARLNELARDNAV